MTNKEVRNCTPQMLQEIRTARGLSVKEFWGRLGYSPSRGYAYEAGRSQVPEHVRRLIYVEYELGIPTDPASDDGKKFAQLLLDNNLVQLLEYRERLSMGAGIISATLSELKI